MSHHLQPLKNTLDLSRLERSLGLTAERIGLGQYRIVGGERPHWVDLYTATAPQCDCGDHLWRDAICKHILAALLREGNERVIQAVGILFQSMKTMKSMKRPAQTQPTSLHHT